MTCRGRQGRVCGPSTVDDSAQRATRVDGGSPVGSISNHTEADAFLALLDSEDQEDKQLQLRLPMCEENEGDHGMGSVVKAEKGSIRLGCARLSRTMSASTSAGVGRSGGGLIEGVLK